MLYNGKYYSALNDGEICSDGNWYPNDIVYKDYYTDEWISSEQVGVVWLADVEEYANCNTYEFDACCCVDCGKWFADYSLMITSVDTNEYYCRECADSNLYHCMGCGDYYSNDTDNIIIDTAGNALCQDCYDGNYTICAGCGEFVPLYNSICLGAEDYCEYCAEDAEESMVIKPYHTEMDYTPLTVEPLYNYNVSDLKLFGFEIEVECDRDLAERTLELLDDMAVLQEDSSVDGFEIITRPMTKEFFFEVFVDKLEQALKYLRENGAKGHNCGGIHIHFSRNNIDAVLGESNLMDLIYCIQGDKESMDKFEIIRQLAQRKQQDLLQWASPYTGNKYSALHYDERTDTYEMRIFNSNLRIERVIKNFEVLLSMIEYSNLFEEDCMNMKYYIKWVMQTQGQYECLKCFIKEKGIDKLISNNNNIQESEVRQCA